MPKQLSVNLIIRMTHVLYIR